MKAEELEPLVKCEADANFGEGWYLYSLYDAEVVEAHIAFLQDELRVRDRALLAMAQDTLNEFEEDLPNEPKFHAQELVAEYLEAARKELEAKG